MNPRFSFIIPVYERPDELEALLESFREVMPEDFPYEIIIVDDGSRKADLRKSVARFPDLPIRFLQQENAGPGAARNYGMQHARGEWFVLIDSDVIFPGDYPMQLSAAVARFPDAGMIGGRDTDHVSFSPFQKAVNLVMTSFCTTGGIRGNKTRVGKFVPRSFNMLVHRKVWDSIGGFSDMHPGEDPEWVYRWWQAGGKTASYPDWKIFHKRRIDLRSFIRQIYKFAVTRVILTKQFPGHFSWVFLAPVGFILFLILSFFFKPVLYLLLFYLLCSFVEFLVRSRDVRVAFLALPLIFIQNAAYAYGLIQGFIHLYLLGKEPRRAFPQLYFKTRKT